MIPTLLSDEEVFPVGEMFGRLSFLQIYSGSLLSFSIFQAAAAVSDFDDTAADGVGAAFEKKAKRARLRLEQAEPAPDVGNEGMIIFHAQTC